MRDVGMVINSGGLGAVSLPPGPSLNSPGWANACGLSYLSYLFNVDCWGESYSAWQQAFYAQAGTLNVPAPAALGVPATALTDPNAVLADTTGAVAQGISDQQILQSQESIAGANPPGPALSCTWLNISCTTWVIGGVIGMLALVAIGGGSPRRYGR